MKDAAASLAMFAFAMFGRCPKVAVLQFITVLSTVGFHVILRRSVSPIALSGVLHTTCGGLGLENVGVCGNRHSGFSWFCLLNHL